MNRKLVWALCAFFVIALRPAGAQVVISQVYGGGGNSGATLTHDFVELLNTGSASIDLTGWSVQYASASGSTWQVTPLSGSIAPGQYYLVQQAKGSGGSVALPPPDATGTIAMAATSGKVALLSSPAALAGACPLTSPDLRDFVGFGSATCFEGTGSTGTLSNTTAALRSGDGCTDSGDNASDFAVGAPSPRNSASGFNTCGAPVSTPPRGTASAVPASLLPGATTLLTVTVTPGTNPDSTGIAVTADLSPIGGSSAQPLTESAANTFSVTALVPLGTASGTKTIAIAIADLQGRSASTSVALNVENASATADHVTISQIYGGGGNSGAPYNRDYVELFNPTASSVDLTGWSVQYASSTGTSWQAAPLEGAIGPGEYYLVALASGATGAPLPDANVSGSINMSATTGKVALAKKGTPLSGCPTADPDLVDLVGFGTANCREGSANASSPSNTTAIFRKNGGAADTNENANDFTPGAPAPRRTAPLLEVGPSIQFASPAANAATAPRDASITVAFTEPVDVDPSWFTIACASTGLHDDATIARNGRTWVITPNASFTPGEQCSVTVFAARVHDQDLDDANGKDTLAADAAWTFTVATGTAPPYDAAVHLAMGNPSGARPDLDAPADYLMLKPEYALSYNRDRGTANWVSWHLSDDWVGTLSRVDSFRPDPAVPPAWYRVQDFDYSFSGFDRGHMVPNADRDKETSIPINQATFLMTNILPQSPDNNQGPWAALENYLRSLLPANEIYVIAGGAGTGGTGSSGFASSIAGGRVAVPSHTWKVALVLEKMDGEDALRAGGTARTIAVVMPNAQGIRNASWTSYLTTVDAVETLTAYDFFAAVPDAAENAIEAGVDGVNPPGAANQSVTASEGFATRFELDAVGGSGGPIAVEILAAPAHGTVSVSGTTATYTPAPGFLGSDSFTWRATDGSRASNAATVSLTVVDVTAPAIAPLRLSSASLWPVNHKMIDVTVAYEATDTADPAPSCALAVSSNEPVNGTGDGDTAPDWEVVDAHRVRLRAERAGTGDGRIYTITAVCRDASGNFAEQRATVSVAR